MPLPDAEAIQAKSHLLPILQQAIQMLDRGRVQEAERLLDSILAQSPDFADALHMKGIAALTRGDLAAAEALVERAIAVDFHFENYHQTLGHVRMAQGMVDAAQQSFGAALTLNREFGPAYLGLAHVLIHQGKLDEALVTLRNAKPYAAKDPELRYLIGYVRMAQGDTKAAMLQFGQALAMSPHTMRFRAAYARALRGFRLKAPDPKLTASILPLLGAPGVEPRDLANVAESAILIEPAIKAVMPLAEAPGSVVAEALARPNFPDLSALPILMAWLQHGLVTSEPLERLLTGLRRGALALLQSDAAALDRHGRWLAALAIRNFHAEYVDAESIGETEALAAADSALSGADPATNSGGFAVLAAYRPLYRRTDAERLAAAAWPPAFREFKRILLDEPLQERRIAAALPALTPIDDATSLSVQDMYEESPFPRWNQPVMGTALPVAQHLRSALPLQSIPPFPVDQPQILVAGCGTGLHAILASTTYQNATVLALDLSRASLAYAKRKTDELGIGNLSYAQADILKIGALPRRFHVIECFGVIHHMREPEAGLAQLVQLLEPGGYMMLGLYSELGRRDVVRARKLIAAEGYSDTPDDIRRFRSDLDRLDPHLAARLRRSSAYHTLSDIRDLLFHRQEHRYTVPQLKTMIEGAGLQFLGFEFTSPQPLTEFRKRFPDDPLAVDFEHWDAFEHLHPDLFGNCYRFWLRKPG